MLELPPKKKNDNLLNNTYIGEGSERRDRNDGLLPISIKEFAIKIHSNL